jgi:hypothetical protein
VNLCVPCGRTIRANVTWSDLEKIPEILVNAALIGVHSWLILFY